MRNIIVAGGCGFIGQNMVKYILSNEEDSYVYVIDNFSTGMRTSLDPLLRTERLEIIEADIAKQSFQEIFSNINIEQIYNFACPASPKYYLKHPIETTKASVLGIINLLDLAVEKGARLLHSSTSEIYGNPQISPQNELYWGEVNSIGPRACYDEGKRCAEALIYDYIRVYNADVRVARIFNTYGPGMLPFDGRVVSNFIIQCLLDENITIYGSGLQTRSICYIDDTIYGLYLLMNTKERFMHPVNIGNPDERSVLDLANIIKKITRSNSKIIHVPEMVDDPQQRCPDISFAKMHLQWEPKTNIYEGLGKTVVYLEKWKNC